MNRGRPRRPKQALQQQLIALDAEIADLSSIAADKRTARQIRRLMWKRSYRWSLAKRISTGQWK